jgi:hypothetical protein
MTLWEICLKTEIGVTEHIFGIWPPKDNRWYVCYIGRLVSEEKILKHLFPIGSYVKTMFADGSHLGWRSGSLDIILKVDHLFNWVKIHLLFRSIPLIQWSVMFCRPCFNRFWGLKYIPRLFSEYMLTFRVEEPMKICVTN